MGKGIRGGLYHCAIGAPRPNDYQSRAALIVCASSFARGDGYAVFSGLSLNGCVMRFIRSFSVASFAALVASFFAAPASADYTGLTVDLTGADAAIIGVGTAILGALAVLLVVRLVKRAVSG